MSISLPNYTKNTLMILFFFIVVSCNQKVDKTDKYIIDRFEKQFYNSKPIELNELKKKYPYFFPKSFPESGWVERLSDPIQQEIFNEIQKKYESVNFLELEISSFFNRNLEINKNFIKPKVITVNTDIDYRNKIILADSIGHYVDLTYETCIVTQCSQSDYIITAILRRFNLIFNLNLKLWSV